MNAPAQFRRLTEVLFETAYSNRKGDKAQQSGDRRVVATPCFWLAQQLIFAPMSRPDKLLRVLTQEETDRLLAQPNQRYFGPHRDYLFMRLMLKTGLRASEATALQPEHLDFMSGKLTVREGKGAKDRPLWVGEEVLGELQEWIGRRSGETGSSDFFLPTRKGTEVADSHLRRSVKRYAWKAEIEEGGAGLPHTLRHTFATWLYRSAGNIRLTQKALGHSDLSTTMIYTHVVDEELEGAMEGL